MDRYGKAQLEFFSNVASKASAFVPVWGKVAIFIGAGALTLFLRDKEKNQDTSPSYSWGFVDSPSAAKGIPMPVIYGEARVRPILKNRYVTVDGDKQKLYALYGVAAHRVDERVLPEYSTQSVQYEVTSEGEYGKTFINNRYDDGVQFPLFNTDGTLGIGWKTGHGTASFANDIIVNGRAITDYHDDVAWETRPGLSEQAVITGFDPTYTNTTTDIGLYRDSAEVDVGVDGLNLIRGSTVGWIAINTHTLTLHQEQFKINGDSFYVGIQTGYLIWDSEHNTNKYSVVSTPPTSPTIYTIATFNITNYNLWEDGYPIYNTSLLPTADDWITPIAELTDAHNIELTFEFPQGLYGQKENGSIYNRECRLFAQYREIGGTWTNFYTGFSIQGDYADPPWWDIVGYHIKRKKPGAFYIQLKAISSSGIFLDPGKMYEMRVTASSPSIVKLVNVATIIYGAQDEDEGWPGFTYPGEPLLGIKALASGQVSGKLDTQVDVVRSKVWVWNTRMKGANKWVQGNANTHAWAVYDKLVNGYYNSDTNLCHPTYPYARNSEGEAIYGCGINPARIDYESFSTWADYTHDILGYELNIVFDTFMTAWDAILRICQEGRGMIFAEGAKIYAYTDKAVSPTQLFTAGNIHIDTFAQKYMGEKTKANSIEVSFFDAERHYEKTLLIMRASDWDSSTELSVPESITLYGTTSARQAESIARFLLMGNELLNNVITFGVDVEALSAQAGDVVEIAHPLLGAGQSGRILSMVEDPGIPNKYIMTLDQTPTAVVGQSYQLKMYHSNGTIQTQNGILIGNIVGNTIGFGTGWTWDPVPEAYDVYSFGISGTHTQQYRITEISRTTDLMRTLTLVQYDEDMYKSYSPADTNPDFRLGLIASSKVPTTDTDTPGEVADILNLASNLRLQEIISHNRITGEYESSIVAAWDTVTGDPKGKWEVWFRDVSVSDVDWEGTWDTGEYDRDDKVELDGKTYISLEDENTTIPFLVTDE